MLTIIEIVKRCFKLFLAMTLEFAFAVKHFRNRQPIHPNNVRSILVIYSCKLGDLIFCEPMFRLIRNNLPSVYITILIEKKYEDFAKMLLLPDKILTVDNHFVANVKKLRLEKFDLVIVPYYNLKHIFYSIFSRTKSYLGYFHEIGLGGRYHTANKLESFGLKVPVCFQLEKKNHVSKWPEAIIKSLFKEGHEYIPKIPNERLESSVNINVKKLVEGMKERLIGIHIGSGWKYRRLPINKTIDFVNSYHSINNICFVFLGDTQEKKEMSLIRPFLKGRFVDFVGDLCIIETCYIISKCDLFVGTDSGLIHCAAALEIPVVGLYGPNLPEISGPLSNKSKVLFEKMSCCPCDQIVCELGAQSCMNKISVHDIQMSANQYIKE